MQIPRLKRFETSPLDIAPLVDVVLLLLLFFMLTSPLVRKMGIQIHLPRVANPDSVSARAAEIKITRDDRFMLMGRELKAEELASSLSGLARSGTPVEIVGDRGCSLGRVAEVWDACKEAGVARVSISVEVRRKEEREAGKQR